MIIVQCCVCKKIKRDGIFVTPMADELIGKQISHGYCPVCVAAVYAEIAACKAANK